MHLLDLLDLQVLVESECKKLLFFQLFNKSLKERIPPHSGAENLKKSRPKKLVKSNKSISRKNFFDQNQFFAISKMAKNPFLNWEKV